MSDASMSDANMSDANMSDASTEPQALPDAANQFVSQQGESLAQTCAGRRTLLVFLRHAGCTFCREALSDLSRLTTQLEQQGVQLAMAIMSSPTNAQRIADTYGLSDAPRFSDPKRTLYRAFGLRRGSMMQLFGPSVWGRGFAALLQGHGIGALDGDGLQMPGAFLIDNDRVISAYRHTSAGDRPDYLALACANA